MASPFKPDENEDYDIETPLEHIRPFGSGLHLKQIAFVPASGSDQFNSTDATISPGTEPRQDVASLYLSMVLPQDVKPEPAAEHNPTSSGKQETSPPSVCEICKLPLGSLVPGESPESNNGAAKLPAPHESSLAHQVCLPHSHPPSALDRSRMGLTYLSTYGWDPDSRRGLGANQEGIKFPIKAKPKDDNLGLGMQVPKNKLRPKKEVLLDAKKVRKMAEEENRKAARIRQQLFGRKDLEKYLGPGA